MKSIKKSIKFFLLKIPFINNYYQIIFSSRFKPGHYHSTIPNLREIEEDTDVIFGEKELAGIELNTENQLQLLNTFKSFYLSYPYTKESSLRYKKEGAWYRYSDSVFLYCMLRSFEPKRIIEVGSGNSSLIMLDTSELFLDNRIRFTFIEPYPDRLLKNLRETDKKVHTIIPKKVQSVKLETFQILDRNDILFIDSSHVSKVGSDVNYLIFEVLPSLNPGVLIHIHDIFFPFEMPKQWVLEKHWFWNENYILHAFLMNNKNYEIVAFNTYLQKIKPDWFKKEMPECLIRSESSGSLWIRKMA